MPLSFVRRHAPRRPVAKSAILKYLLSMAGVCLLACGLVCTPIVKDVLIHDYALYQYSQTIHCLEYPENTIVLSSKKQVGLFSGSGDQCNYFVGKLRWYTGDRHAIESFYLPQQEADSRVGVLFVGNGEFPDNASWWLPRDIDSLPLGWVLPPKRATTFTWSLSGGSASTPGEICAVFESVLDAFSPYQNQIGFVL